MAECIHCDGIGRVECPECGHDESGEWLCAGFECTTCNGTGEING